MEVLPPGSGPVFGATGDFGSVGAFADVGEFRPGSPASRWALGRFLLGRALAVQVSRALLVVALAIAAIAIGVYFAGLTVLTVLLGLVAVAVLVARAILGAILRRLTFPALSADDDRRLRRLVGDTRKDVARELHRVGVPGSSLTLPLLALRLAGRNRATVLARLRNFDIERVVPAARLDELHLLLGARGARATGGGPAV
jgi:hypothetical protein